MPNPLIVTKTVMPMTREQLVVRERFFASLDALRAPGYKLGLAAAPAGYGKTTLVGAWIEQRGLPVVLNRRPLLDLIQHLIQPLVDDTPIYRLL